MKYYSKGVQKPQEADSNMASVEVKAVETIEQTEEPVMPMESEYVMPSVSDNEQTRQEQGMNESVIPILPDYNESARPDEESNEVVLPVFPDQNESATPESPNGSVTPSLPDYNIPTSPGEGPIGSVMPMLPNPSYYPDCMTPSYPIGPNITVIPVVPSSANFSYIRFLNAIPNSNPVDIYLNGRRIVQNLSYRGFTEYFKVASGVYRVVVYEHGKASPIFTARLTLGNKRIYTAALINQTHSADMTIITDIPRAAATNRAYLRFINLAPTAPRMDVYLNGTLVVSDLDYKEVSNYLSLRPETYSLQLKITGTDDTILEDPQVSLRNGNFYAVYVVGDIGTKPGLQVLIPLEGTTYLSF